jgi:prepilin-type N-terminal cleavage/methylation domain-containing protein
VEDQVKTSSRGFSLIELLIVVTIILIIAAIAIPNFLRSRVAANQASAVASLHTLILAEATYCSTYGGGYSVDLQSLAGPATAGATPTSTAAGLIDSALASGSKSGYSFAYSPGAVDTSGRINTFNLTATPISSSTGTNYYYTDESGVIRMNATTTASSTDSPVGG